LRRVWLALLAALLASPAAPRTPRTNDLSSRVYDPFSFRALSWRNIGPDRGGRSIAVAGSESRPLEYYFGATGGGLWKTTDGGTSFRPVTDGQIRSSSVGAIAVAPSSPDVVYIGMGEAELRGNAMEGDGLYKSVDAGRTWVHLGLEETRAIARIRVDPRDPDVVYVAALGHHAAPNEERGVFRSLDGGRSFRKVLDRGPRTGAVDLVLDARDPDVIYASMWQVYRNAYQLWSGGPESGLFRSADAGETWSALSANEGFPRGDLGKIGVAVSPADSRRVYAVVEAKAGGLYRSDDAGASWVLANDSRDLWQRSFYFNRLTADPLDRDTVYVLNFALFRSEDGGKTIEAIQSPHADHHDLWIDPRNPQRMIEGNDGGATVSVNRGGSWTPQTYPTAQIYHVATTRDFPYHVVGAQQDNTTAALSSQPDAWWQRPGEPTSGAFYEVGGGENAYVATHPGNPDVFFAGATNTLTRFDRRTGEARDVQPFPRIFMGESSAEVSERWNWVYPIVMTRHEPYRLYAASQHVFRSLDEGRSWEMVSPDLTRADPETMGPSGGPIVLDQDGPEIYATVFTLAPSEVDPELVWAGSDDGLVHLTQDGGLTWSDVTPKGMVRETRVSLIEASPHDAATAYLAAKRNQMDDRTPYIWRTRDLGRSWERIERGIRENDFVHAVREDPVRPGLLYAGTEHGVYVSFDGGDQWSSLSLELPDVPVPDLAVEERDLVIATHGRSFYVLDDVAPLRQLARDGEEASVHLFRPADAVRRVYRADVDVYVPDAGIPVRVSILDGSQNLVRELALRDPRKGLNRVSWDLRYPGATVFEGMVLESQSPARGPWAPPGRYFARLSSGGKTWTEPFELRKDPRLTDVTGEDLREQFDLATKIRDRTSAANEAVIRIRELKRLVLERTAELPESESESESGSASTPAPASDLRAIAGRVVERLSAVEGELYQVKNRSPKDKIAFPIKLDDRLAGLLWNVELADHAPNRAHYQVFEQLSSELDTLLRELEAIRKTDLASLNEGLRVRGLPPVER
jgi:photosystem II stability/assembly factor-like uncharacterized protein